MVDCLVALQPGYLPWLGFFDQLRRCDLFVVEDSLQFTKGSWRVRNRILTPSGTPWLTVPTVQGGRSTARIQDVKIASGTWARKHWNQIAAAYRKAPYFDRYSPFLEEVYLRRSWEYLVDLDMALIRQCAEWLEISTPMVLLSSTGIAFDENGSGSLVRLCKHFGAARFFEGAVGKEYLEKEPFEQAGITLEFQEYQHKPYRQLHTDDFVSHLCVLDLLFNEGPDSKNFI